MHHRPAEILRPVIVVLTSACPPLSMSCEVQDEAAFHIAGRTIAALGSSCMDIHILQAEVNGKDVDPRRAAPGIGRGTF